MHSLTSFFRGTSHSLVQWLRSLSATEFAILAVLAAAAIQYDLETWPLNMALSEGVVVACLLLLAFQWNSRERFWRSLRRPVPLLFAGLTTWAFLTWLIVPDWRYAIDDLRWLVLSSLLFVFVLSSERPVRNGAAAFVCVAVLVAVMDDILMLGGVTAIAGRVQEKILALSPLETYNVTVPVGFFRNSNMMAGYLFWPMLLGIALLLGTKHRALALAGVGLLAANLLLSIARGVQVGMVLAIMVLVLIRRLRTPRRLVAALVALGLGVFVVGTAVVLSVPPEGFFTSLWGRFELWATVVRLFSSYPRTFLLGAGSGLALRTATNWTEAYAPEDPHNIYLYMTMHYGLIGLLVLLAVGYFVLRRGWDLFLQGKVRESPLRQVMWAGWIVFPLMGLLDSYINKFEWRIIFLLPLALWMAETEEETMPPGIDPQEIVVSPKA